MNETETMPLVSIGMPVYNGGRFIHEALDSLLAQNFKDFELIISDNASEDDTADICKKYCGIDNRIKYYRNDKNIGVLNFRNLLYRANLKYFMWAAHDDIWHPDFLSSCVKMLDENENIGMAFSNIVNTDSFNRIIRTYPSFKQYAGESSFRLICKYTTSPESHGKANLIYSVYRLKLCKEAWEASPLKSGWGSDMSFVLAAISRSGLCIDDRVLFQKRMPREIDRQDFVSKIVINHPNLHIFPFTKSIEYIRNNLRAVRGTNYFYLVLIIMLARMPQAFIAQFINFIKKRCRWIHIFD